MKLFGKKPPQTLPGELSGTGAMAQAIKDAQLRAFQDGWVDGCEIALLMVLGSGGDGSYTGDVPEEIRDYIVAALNQVRIEKRR